MSEMWIPQGIEWTDQWIEAAVLLPCYKKGDREFLIFTQRTDKVAHHKGQISFPGGVTEADDADLWATALRETHEEIGLDPAQVARHRALSPQFTPTGYRVTPYAGTIVVPPVWNLNPNEIAAIFAVPLDHLRDPKHHEFLTKELSGHQYIDPHFYFEGHVIWGVTGRIVCEFLGIDAASD